MGRIISAAIMLLALAGCAAMQEQEAQKAVSQARETCDDRLASPELDPIRGKVAFRADRITPDLLTVPGTPNAAEKAALKVLFQKKQACDQESEANAEKYAPAIAVDVQAAHAQYGVVLAKLYQGEISYGNANQLIQQAYLEHLEHSQETARQEAAQQQQRQMMWLGYMQQQQALQQQQQATQQQQLIQQQQMTKPTTTNCRWLGSTLNCNSY